MQKIQRSTVSPFTQQLDKQIDDFECRDDNDGIHHDIKLVVRWTVRDIFGIGNWNQFQMPLKMYVFFFFHSLVLLAIPVVMAW